MYVHEKLKLNKFEFVRIPTKKEYFKRIGETNLGSNAYTGDEKAPTQCNKCEELDKTARQIEKEMLENNTIDD